MVGSRREESAGFGAIIRDSLGDHFVVAYGGCHPISVTTHELQGGVELGLLLAIRIQAQSIHVCTHSLTVCCLLLYSADAKPLWKSVTALLSEFASVKISHRFRETNQAADHLTKIHPKDKFVDLVIEDFSPDFKKILAAYKAGTVYFRA